MNHTKEVLKKVRQKIEDALVRRHCHWNLLAANEDAHQLNYTLKEMECVEVLHEVDNILHEAFCAEDS